MGSSLSQPAGAEAMSLSRGLVGLGLLLSLGTVILPVLGLPWLTLVIVGGGVAWTRSGRGGWSGWFRTLDETLFAGETLLVSVSLLVMAFVVFLDVIWRSAAGMDAATGARFAVGAAVLVGIGAFTARAPSAGLARRLAWAALVYVVLAGGTWLIIQAENGFGWSQRLALVLVIWVGLIGGSMATRMGRHIAVDAVQRIVPERFARPLLLVSGSVTVLTCLFLALVGGMYCRGNWDDWLLTERRSFLFESLPIPYWTATLAMPIGFGLMAARFLGGMLSPPRPNARGPS